MTKRIIISILFFVCLTATRAQENYSQLRGSPEDSMLVRNFPGSWNLPNTDLHLKFGGYFRLDAIYDFTGAGSRNQLLMGQIPANNTPEAAAGPFFNMHVRETRFNFDLRRTTDAGKSLKFFLEFDFFDESISPVQPRLRHAFVKYGNLLIGHTWTNLIDLRIFPFIMDFSAGDALFGGRAVQIKWEQDFAKQFQYGFSLEMPELNGIYNPDSLTGEIMPVLPILSGRLSNIRGNSMVILGGQIEQLRWDGLKQSPNATKLGWVIVLNGRQTITEKFFVTWHTSYNSGITSQILIFGGTNQGAVLLPTGELFLENAITFAIGGGYQLNKVLSTNLAFAYMDRGKLDYRPANTLESGGMGHANLIWQIDTRALAGIEFAWGNINNLDNANGEAYRIQTMIKYSF